MATANVNGVRLFYEISGTGEEPLILVHGSWASHSNWDLVVPELAETSRVLTYDRRGHSDSERPVEQSSIHKDVADLAAVIEHLELGPVWVIGNSHGGSIALRLAAERPDLLQGVIAHEPPLFSLLADDPAMMPVLEEFGKRSSAVVERIAAGDHAGGAEQFMETVALGPGSWAQLPPDQRQICIGNAPTYLNNARDPEVYAFDLAWIEDFFKPVLLTQGDQSPPTFAPVIAKLAGALPNAEVVTFPGAGHIPHVTHPEAYAEAITAFVQKNQSVSLVG